MASSIDQSQLASAIISELASISEASADIRNDEGARVRAVHLAKKLTTTLETPGESILSKGTDVSSSGDPNANRRLCGNSRPKSPWFESRLT